MYLFPIWYLIIITCVEFALGLLLTYTLGVIQGNFRPIFPYISDTGAYPIENGFFVLVFAITSFLVIIIIYIRFKDAHTHLEGLFHRIFNFIVLVIGVAAIFFLMGVAAFESDDSSLSSKFHFTCAGLTIFLELFFEIGQVIIGIMLPPKRVWWKWIVFAIQLSITTICLVLAIFFFALIFHPSRVFYRENRNSTMVDTITSDLQNNATQVEFFNLGLRIDYARACTEWMLFVLVVAFYFTFIPDFNRIQVNLVITRPKDIIIMEKVPTGEVQTS
ncbi:DNA damage-regulated autophagy modulator protein 1-like [Oopsacas minuta]|uniref:DNA damage-regulated autophagy modulator protein 1-like n=1 Tax=Oopsacas minuta TaxID=111878 RepID=A0AAV7JL03_9METZ|nr:DNA damage-regulated autophagy modulator protein 1-like [Oopsacas minuta]